MHILHLPFAASHAEHPVAKALDLQQRPPLQASLVHQSSAEHEAPTSWLFFAAHLKSASR
jgi:hypothetical protein